MRTALGSRHPRFGGSGWVCGTRRESILGGSSKTSMFLTVPQTHPDPPSTGGRWPWEIKCASSGCAIADTHGVSLRKRWSGRVGRKTTALKSSTFFNAEPRIETRSPSDPVTHSPRFFDDHPRWWPRHPKQTKISHIRTRAIPTSCTIAQSNSPQTSHNHNAPIASHHLRARQKPATILSQLPVFLAMRVLQDGPRSVETPHKFRRCPASELFVSNVGRVANTTPPQGGNTPAGVFLSL